MKIKTDNIFQVVEIDASISDVYKCLIDEKLHAKFTGMSAHISKEVGGEFETCDGANSGFNIYLKKNEKIVQAWSQKEMGEGVYTIVNIELEKIEHGTRINFNHLGVPEEHSGRLTEGWKKVYWGPLTDFLTQKVLS
ncbi:MAG: SRPBCC domain-containing protein [Flavobacteriales bacterium]|nr:SRPBCC domain-containing protein [Flavobacteriales bacterium]